MMQIKLCKPSHLQLHFFESVWSQPNIRSATNCFAYSLNIPDAGFATPGNLWGLNAAGVEHIYNPTCLHDGLVDDGLEKVTPEEALSTNAHFIAALSLGDADFHFLRKHQDGLWRYIAKAIYFDHRNEERRRRISAVETNDA